MLRLLLHVSCLLYLLSLLPLHFSGTVYIVHSIIYQWAQTCSSSYAHNQKTEDEDVVQLYSSTYLYSSDLAYTLSTWCLYGSTHTVRRTYENCYRNMNVQHHNTT